MQRTRRYWTFIMLAVALAGTAILVDRLLPLLGAAALIAWVLARQYAFVREAERVTAGMEADLALVNPRALVDTQIDGTLTLVLADETRLTVDGSVEPPVATRIDDGATVTLGDETRAATTFSLACPVAGRHELEPPTVTLADDLFVSRRTVGNGDTLQVDPRSEASIHVGEGGQTAGVGATTATGQRTRSGLLPGQLREYTPDDDARHIDWRATARLDEPYVQEYEAETEETIVLVVDHSSATAAGNSGATQLDYLREIALTFTDTLDVPLALFTVDGGGLTNRIDAGTGADHYDRVRETLTTLQPADTTTESDRHGQPQRTRHRHYLLGRESTFATQLRPFLSRSETYAQRFETEPLFSAVQTALAEYRDASWVVVLTGDDRRAELWETVTTAGQYANRATVFLAPAMLFGTGLSALEPTYKRYADFDQFRSELAAVRDVHAFEVAPQDRVDSVLTELSARRARR